MQTEGASSGFRIRCSDVPPELLLKNTARQHFQQFGRVIRMTLRQKSRACVVEYGGESAVQRAVSQGGEFNGKKFRVTREASLKKLPKKKTRKDPDPPWLPDDLEVLAELEAMAGKKQYNLRGEAMEVEALIPMKEAKKKAVKTKPKKPQAPLKAGPTLKVSEQFDLLNLIRQPAMTAEERYRVLEARDKLMRLQTKRSTDLSKVARTVGTCPDMCPEKERLMREAQHQVALYEQEAGGKSMDPKLAIKQYSRSSADQEFPLPHELRPVNVLQMTMCYLMHRIINLCDSPDVNLGEWYHFLWDRTRGIRKDITQQELCCPGSVELIEQCARFHIHCSARLVAEDPSVFDQKINTENLTKCLQTLKYMYHDLSLKGVSCANEAEFRAYIILLNLNDGNFMWELQQFRADIQKSTEVRFALAVYSAIDKNNYTKFFKLVRSTSYLNACILLRYFTQVRIGALKVTLKSYLTRSSLVSYPIGKLTNLLAFEDAESTVDFLGYFGLTVNPERTHLFLDRKPLALPENSYSLERAVEVVESKRCCSVGEVVCGRALPEAYFEDHVPQNSFDDEGVISLNGLIDESDEESHADGFRETDEDESALKIEAVTDEDEKDLTRGGEAEALNRDVVDDVGKTAKFLNTNFTYANIFTGVIQETPPNKPDVGGKPFVDLFKTNSSTPPSNGSIFQDKGKIPASTLFREPPPLQTKPFYFIPVASEETKTNEPTPVAFSAPASRPKENSLSVLKQETQPSVVATEPEVKPARSVESSEEAKARRRLLEEIKEKEARKSEAIRRNAGEIRDYEIDEMIASIAREVLAEEEEIRRRKRLEEIAAGIKKRKLKAVLDRWSAKVVSNRRKRKAVEFSPAWLTSRDVKEEAGQLYTRSQDETLNMRKRYRYGKAMNLIPPLEKEVPKVDLFDLTYYTLIKKFAGLHRQQKAMYWKVSVSLQETTGGRSRIEEILNKFFQWKEQNGSVNYMEQVHVGNLPQVTFCVEKMGCEETDTNGLILIGLELNEAFVSHVVGVLKLIKSLVPVAVVILGDFSSDILASALKTSSAVSEYQIFSNCFTTRNVIALLEESLVFVAAQTAPPPPLELDTLEAFLTKHLCTELWQRVSSYSKWNSLYRRCLKSPEVAIHLHNKAVEMLKCMIFDPRDLSHADFPATFSGFAKNDRPEYLPCDYKFFPKFWKSEEYRLSLAALIRSFCLPRFTNEWPPRNRMELEDCVLNYCRKMFPEPEKPFYRILSYVLRDENNFEEVLWTDIVEIIAKCKLESSDLSLGCDFMDKSPFKVHFVVYNPNSVREYSSSTWFYVDDLVVRGEMRKTSAEAVEVQKEAAVAPAAINCSNDIDIDKMLNELLVGDAAVNENLKKRKAELKEIELMLDDLEETMHVQKAINKRFGVALSALKDF